MISKRLFPGVLAAAGAFVWLTSVGLPPVVASHFGPGGGANGYSGKGVYTLLMVGLVLGVPMIVAGTTVLMRVVPRELVNLPNKDYWLAPERQASSLEALSSLSFLFATALTCFLCFVHWLIVQANSVQPPRLDERGLFIGLAAFGVSAVAWVFSLFRRFSKVP